MQKSGNANYCNASYCITTIITITTTTIINNNKSNNSINSNNNRYIGKTEMLAGNSDDKCDGGVELVIYIAERRASSMTQAEKGQGSRLGC